MLSAVRSVVAGQNGMADSVVNNDMFVLSAITHLFERKHNQLVFLTSNPFTHSSWVKRTEVKLSKKKLYVEKPSRVYSKYSLIHPSHLRW